MMLKTVLVVIILLVVGVYGAVRFAQKNAKPDNRVAFAQCLADKGVKFYGAYWCPHCQAQKKVFGSRAASKLNYIECAVPGNNSDQTQTCKDANITSYPTWIFADGSRETGEKSLDDLAEKSGCSLEPIPAVEPPQSE